MAVSRATWRGTGRSRHLRRDALRIACTLLACIGLCGISEETSAFLAGPAQQPRSGKSCAKAWPWEAEGGGGSAKGKEAYAIWAKEFETSAKTGLNMGDDVSEGIITGRFEGLASMVGEDTALLMVQKEPIVLLWSTKSIQGSFEYLKEQEATEVGENAAEAVLNNPRLLTVPKYEYERTKPTLASLALAAKGFESLRFLGPFGSIIGITAVFVGGITTVRLIQNGLTPVIVSLQALLPAMPSLKPFDLVRGVLGDQ